MALTRLATFEDERWVHDEAAAAHRATLAIWTREAEPLNWAMGNLATALQMIEASRFKEPSAAELDEIRTRLEEARSTYEELGHDYAEYFRDLSAQVDTISDRRR
jgi:hypothetical protein